MCEIRKVLEALVMEVVMILLALEFVRSSTISRESSGGGCVCSCGGACRTCLLCIFKHSGPSVLRLLTLRLVDKVLSR